VPVRANWKAAVFAGLAAAIVSLIVETPLVWLIRGESPWPAARMAAAMVLGPKVLSPASFDPGVLVVATLIHLALSVVYGVLLALFLARAGRIGAGVIGAFFGLFLYLVNLHVIAPLWFPWFAPLRTGLTVFSHLVFGVALGVSYVVLRDRVKNDSRSV